ncbi:MAG: ATP-binding cassette domain-containing protein [Planctomycetes bacterium]|nr:ATP-binding cassette domain-containing protein [Planctomycetota bacterium]
MNAVEIEDVTKTFGRHIAVDSLSLAVPRGCIYGFIGPNGSGKTTTLRMIMNILVPDRGAIRVLGDPLAGARTDRIGYMPEERGLYRKMKVLDFLRFYGALKGARDAKAEAARWLAKLGLEDWANRKIEALSKGMGQKVQFIAAVISHPELILLDEPFAGLDPVNADAIREEILALWEGGATVILSTHDMHIAEAMCEFIFMIHEGRKVLDGTLRSIQDRFGRDAIRISIEGGDRPSVGIEGVARIADFGQVQELQLTGERDPQAIVSEIMARARVVRFEVTRPSLHDIFVRIAGAGRREAKDA